MRTFIGMILIGMLSLNAPYLKAGELSMESVKLTLDKLYKANGNFIFIKPGIRISEREFAVAQYLANENVIILERKLLQLCYEFGKDSLNALAFVIGHELVHCNTIQNKKRDFATNFLARSQEHVTTDEEEHNADVQGLFSTWLAGFDAISIVPEILSGIYLKYGLNNKLAGYPDLDIRKKANQELMEQVKLLIQVFENANYLIAANEYELARASLHYVLRYYQGREVLNNLGTAYLLEATQWNDPRDLFIYPIELDPLSRLATLRTSRGEQAVSNEKYRLEYLNKACGYFEAALQLSFDYFPAELNLMNAKTMLGDYKFVTNRLKEPDLAKRKLMGLLSGLEFNQARAILAIATYKLNKQTDAQMLWMKISSYSTDSLLVLQARHNMEFAKGNSTCFIYGNSDCISLIGNKKMIDSLKLHRQKYIGRQLDLLDGKYELAIKAFPNSSLFVYSKSKQVAFVLQKMDRIEKMQSRPSLNTKPVILTTRGFVINCKETKTIFQMNSTANKILDYAYYASYK